MTDPLDELLAAAREAKRMFCQEVHPVEWGIVLRLDKAILGVEASRNTRRAAEGEK